MFGQLLGFELKLQMRQIGFWITVALMALAGFLIMGVDFLTLTTGSGERVKANGAGTVALSISALGFLAIFFGAIFVVSGVMRDETNKSLEIIHATPVPTWMMTSTRMIGVFLATFLSIFAGVIGLFAGQFSPFIDRETLGPINILYFLQPTLVFVAVNALIVSALFTAVAALTRNRTLVYVSAIGLFMLYNAAGLFVGEDAPNWLIAMVDPFGANALAVETEFWPAEEQNTRLAPLFSYVGLNRLVWGGFAGVLLLGVFGLFKRGLVTRKTKLGTVEQEPTTRRRLTIDPLGARLSFGALASIWTRFKHEYLSTVRSISFLILSVLALGLFALTIYVQAELSPDPILPTNISLAQIALGSAFLPLAIMIVFFSGEIIWRDKSAGISEILDATPVKNGPLMIGKWLAMFAVVLTIVALAVVLGMLAQLLLGSVPLNPITHLRAGFLTFAPDLLLYAALLMFIQNFMPNRIVGMVAGGALLMFFVFFDTLLPFYHPLMGYGDLPTGGLSEMNGLGTPLRFGWFALYWGSLALVFAVLTNWLWRRGLQTSLLSRLTGLARRITPVTAALGLAGLAGFGTAGATIYSSYTDDGGFETRNQRESRQARFEKEIGDLFLYAPSPKIRSVAVEADMSPSMRTARFSGTYDIENTTGAPLHTVFVAVPNVKAEQIDVLTVDGANWVKRSGTSDTLRDANVRAYRFDTPVPIGGMFGLQFDLRIPPPTIGGAGAIRKNGTFVNNFVVTPQIGVPDNRLTNPDRRRANGLDELDRAPDRDNLWARQFHFIGRSSDYVDFSAKMCTDPGQIPIAPGKLERTYDENGRTCRDYKAINPILNFFSFISADYEVRRDEWENPDGPNVDLAVYYHRSHDYNIDLMVQAMKDSLDTFTDLFGPYQYSQVRIMEFPYASFAQAFAGTIPFSENIGFMRNPGDPDDVESIDLATYVTMHEIGHQWFAHQIVPAAAKGFNVLSEGLTENAAYTAYERRFGWQRTKQLLEQRGIRQYLLFRTVDSDNEPPLALAEGQQYLDYQKASWVFWGLKQYIGEDNMQGAIRAFLDEFGSKGPPYPTTAELVDYLREAAGPDYQQLITDYWDRITFWDLAIKADTLAVEETGDRHTIRLTLTTDKKIASEETGKETSVSDLDNESLNEWVEIGVYTQDPKDTLGAEWIALERVHVTEPETEIEITVEEPPTHVLVDPRRLLIERNVDDNGSAVD